MRQNRPSQLDSPLLPKIFKYAGKAHVWVYPDREIPVVILKPR
jgi:hypothetical protein